MTPVFVVVLGKVLHGATVGSTRDEDAPDADIAERAAMEAWREFDPRFTYAPLATTQR